MISVQRVKKDERGIELEIIFDDVEAMMVPSRGSL